MNPVFTILPGWQIFLASASPRRLVLLNNIGIEVKVISANFQETEPLPHHKPLDYALDMASSKMAAAKIPHVFQRAVIAADTIVCLGDRIFGKPASTQDAVRMLKQLAGKEHKVISAAMVRVNENISAKIWQETSVIFEDWPDMVLQAYVNGHEPMDKAGAYAIQGEGSFLIKEIRGSVTNVIGLPLTPLIKFLLQNEVISATEK